MAQEWRHLMRCVAGKHDRLLAPLLGDQPVKAINCLAHNLGLSGPDPWLEQRFDARIVQHLLRCFAGQQHEFPAPPQWRHRHHRRRPPRVAHLQTMRRQPVFVFDDRIDHEPWLVETVVEQFAVDHAAHRARAAVGADQKARSYPRLLAFIVGEPRRHARRIVRFDRNN